jgi:hypothetical protein
VSRPGKLLDTIEIKLAGSHESRMAHQARREISCHAAGRPLNLTTQAVKSAADTDGTIPEVFEVRFCGTP